MHIAVIANFYAWLLRHLGQFLSRNQADASSSLRIF